MAVLERFGTRRPVAPGDILFRTGDRGHGFYVVIFGALAIVEYAGRPDQPEITVHRARRFLGELDLFSSQPVTRTALAICPGEIVHVPRDRLRKVFAADHELRELVLRTFLVRRSMLLEPAADLRNVGRSGSPDTRRLQEYADAHRLTATFVDLEDGGDGDRLGAAGAGLMDRPNGRTGVKKGAPSCGPENPLWERHPIPRGRGVKKRASLDTRFRRIGR